jgi:hypothetical protein
MLHDKLTNLLATVSRQLAVAIDRLRQRRVSANEVERLDPQEMKCLAQDLGIPAGELRILAAKDKDAADLLARRMETLGLDPARVDSAVMRDLQRCCSKCKDKGRCVHELEDHPRDPLWPKYCPNDQTLAALTEEQRGGAPSQSSAAASMSAKPRTMDSGRRYVAPF